MNKPIKLGIIGVGRAGYRMHLKEMEGKGLFEIYAVCDLEDDRLEMMNRLDCKNFNKATMTTRVWYLC